MQVSDIMTKEPACCSPTTSIKDAAKLMVDRNCGEVPVLDERGCPVGVVTDRDIACRGVAAGMPSDTPVSRVMSISVVTVTPETSVTDCCNKLEENQIRRAPVINNDGACCGMISQADIALHAKESEIAQVVREISKPNG